MAKLDEQQLKEALGKLPGWIRAGNAIEQTFEFDNFSSAMVFTNKVAEAAEEADHHPDIDIRYSKVKMLLTSHDSGGVTQRDVKMAKRISEIGRGGD
jgi:4a-hydroxytetrahydrobiopterin dehydratase